MDINQTVEACSVALQLHQAVDYNQTIIAVKEASQVKDFSRFSSLLEVAFALNVSYHIIPNMHNLGKKKIDDIEAKKKQEWESKIAELGTTEDDVKAKTKYQTLINTIESTSDESTTSEKLSIKISSIAPYAAIVSVVLLFLGSLGIGCMNSLTPLTRDILQTLIVIILLLPNIIALGFQLTHWKKVEENLKTVIAALEKNE